MGDFQPPQMTAFLKECLFYGLRCSVISQADYGFSFSAGLN